MKILHQIKDHFVGRVVTLALATAFSVVLSLSLLPLATRVLQASDYGMYALLMSIVALVSTTMDGGASLILPAHYQASGSWQRGRLFASLTVIAAAGASTLALLLVGVWSWEHTEIAHRAIPLSAIIITAILIPLRAITNILTISFSVTGRSGAIAAQLACQAAFAFLSTLAALFQFSMGGVSLFIGAACGQIAALGIGLIVLRRHQELSFPARRWILRAIGIAPTSGTSGLIDGARDFGESAIIAGTIGLHSAGIYSHARLYYNLLLALRGTITHNIRSRSLADARNPLATFRTTLSAWQPVQMAFSCLGLFFVFYGTDVVNVISNGKFVEAAAYIPALFIIALFHTTGQRAEAIVYASNMASSATWFRTALVLICLAALYPVVLFFGIDGLLSMGIAEAFFHRLYLRHLASRHRRIPFEDGIALFGCFVIALAEAYMTFAAPQLGTKALLLMAGILLTGLVGRRSVAEIAAVVRQIVRAGERVKQ